VNLRHLLPLLLLPGCLSLERESPAQLRYVLEVQRPDRALAETDEVLLVQRFHAATDANSRPFVYRLTDHQVEVDFYHELMVPPAATLEDATARWLDAAGLFAQVERPGTRRSVDFELTGDLTDWWIDLRDPEQPRAIVGVTLTLLRPDATRVLWHRALRASEPCDERTPEACVAGWNRAVESLLVEVESGIREAVAATRREDPDLR
jgi:ABC-type uncharacterized transport system auxiliary subunit